jgi:hypothetical protein
MQNKPNFRKAKMKLSPYSTKDYENVRLCRFRQNKPNQTQFQKGSISAYGRLVIIRLFFSGRASAAINVTLQQIGPTYHFAQIQLRKLRTLVGLFCFEVFQFELEEVDCAQGDKVICVVWFLLEFEDILC